MAVSRFFSPIFPAFLSKIGKKCRFEPTLKKPVPQGFEEKPDFKRLSAGNGLQKRPQTGHPRHSCIKDSKSGSRASGSWVRIPPYPPRSRQQSVFRLLAFLFAQMKPPANISRAQTPHHRPPLRLYTVGDRPPLRLYSEGDENGLYAGTSAKVTHQLHEQSQSMGSVSVTGKNIDMKKVVWFVRSAELASKSVVYPKTDGTVCMTFPFHGLARPIE